MTDKAQKVPRKPVQPAPAQQPKIGWFRKLIASVLPLLVLGGGAYGAYYFIVTSPKPPQRPPRRSVVLVEYTAVAPARRRVVIHAMGTVTPARQIVLQPRIKGEIVRISDELVPGGLIKAGQFILEVDPTDYKLAVERLSGQVAQAELAWELEVGQQAIAKSEYELLGETGEGPETDLILRKPHLEAARAVLVTARAAKAQADLDLERTKITTPFNATVLAKLVDLGGQVSSSTQLATLAGTDEYWLKVSVPVSRLKWLTIPRSGSAKGSQVRVFDDTGWGRGVHRVGHVTRLMGSIETEGRMARVLVTIPDPLAVGPDKAGKPAMLIGDLLRVEIDGTVLDGVFDIPRTALRYRRREPDRDEKDDERRSRDQVWLLDADSKLEIRDVEVVWRERDRILIRSGLAAGDKLITSDLAAPVGGMPLQTARPASRGGGAASQASGAKGPTTQPDSRPAERP